MEGGISDTPKSNKLLKYATKLIEHKLKILKLSCYNILKILYHITLHKYHLELLCPIQ